MTILSADEPKPDDVTDYIDRDEFGRGRVISEDEIRDYVKEAGPSYRHLHLENKASYVEERVAQMNPESRPKRAWAAVREKDSAHPNVKWAVAGVVALFLAIWFAWWMWFATHTENVTVESVSWERKIEVIQYLPRQRTAWYSHPDDAYDVSSSYEIHHWEQYVSHYRTETYTYSCGDSKQPRTCSGSRSVAVYASRPVYAWKYRFKVNRWDHSRWIPTSGVDQKPFWDDMKDEHFDGRDVIGNEQLSGERGELYLAHIVKENGEKSQRGLDLPSWSRVKVGAQYTANVNRAGQIRSVDWPV